MKAVDAEKTAGLLSTARSLVQGGHYEAAVSQLEAALEFDSANVEVLKMLSSLRQTVEQQPRDRHIERLLNRADAFLQNGDIGRAQAVASEVFNLAPDNQAALELLEQSSGLGDTLVGEAKIQPADDESYVGDLAPEDRLLIEKIDRLLAGPAMPDPAEVAATSIVTLIRKRDLQGAYAALTEAEGTWPQAPQLSEVRAHLEHVVRQVRLWVEQTRNLVQAQNYGEALGLLDRIDSLTRDHLEARDLRATAQAGVAQQKYSAERSQAISSASEAAGLLLTSGRLKDAARHLETTEQQWGEAVELAELKTRLVRAGDDRVQAASLLAEATEQYQAGDYRQVIEILDRATPLDPWSRELQELRARTQGALDRHRKSSSASIRSVVLSLGILAGLTVAIAMTVSRESPVGEKSLSTPQATGAIQVTLSAFGRTMLDGMELPEEGAQDATVHHFRDVEAGTHTVTIWRQGASERVVRQVTVEGRRTTRLEVEVPW